MSKRFAVEGSFLKVVFTILLVSQSLSDADATLRPMESIDWSFRAASTVVLLRIDESQILYVDNDACGVRYSATILETFKGRKDSENRQIQFGRFSGLETEKTYLAFLDHDDDPEVVYRKVRDETNLPDIKDDAEKKKAMSQIACKGLVPGLRFNVRFTWPVVLNYVIVTGLLPASMPVNVRVHSTDTAQWWIQKQDLFSYLQTLKRQKN